MSMADELAETRTYISDLRHQLGEAHKRHKAMADALAVRADENQRLEYELRKANERGDAWRDELRSDEARIAELEAEVARLQGVARDRAIDELLRMDLSYEPQEPCEDISQWETNGGSVA